VGTETSGCPRMIRSRVNFPAVCAGELIQKGIITCRGRITGGNARRLGRRDGHGRRSDASTLLGRSPVPDATSRTTKGNSAGGRRRAPRATLTEGWRRGVSHARYWSPRRHRDTLKFLGIGRPTVDSVSPINSSYAGNMLSMLNYPACTGDTGQARSLSSLAPRGHCGGWSPGWSR